MRLVLTTKPKTCPPAAAPGASGGRPSAFAGDDDEDVGPQAAPPAPAVAITRVSLSSVKSDGPSTTATLRLPVTSVDGGFDGFDGGGSSGQAHAAAAAPPKASQLQLLMTELQQKGPSGASGGKLGHRFRAASWDEDAMPPITGSNDPHTSNIQVTYLAPTVTEETLAAICKKYGELLSVKILWPRTAEEQQRGRNTGYVCFATRAQAEAAVRGLWRANLEGLRLGLAWAHMPKAATPVGPPTGPPPSLPHKPVSHMPPSHLPLFAASDALVSLVEAKTAASVSSSPAAPGAPQPLLGPSPTASPAPRLQGLVASSPPSMSLSASAAPAASPFPAQAAAVAAPATAPRPGEPAVQVVPPPSALKRRLIQLFAHYVAKDGSALEVLLLRHVGARLGGNTSGGSGGGGGREEEGAAAPAPTITSKTHVAPEEEDEDEAEESGMAFLGFSDEDEEDDDEEEEESEEALPVPKGGLWSDPDTWDWLFDPACPANFYYRWCVAHSCLAAAANRGEPPAPGAPIPAQPLKLGTNGPWLLPPPQTRQEEEQERVQGEAGPAPSNAASADASILSAVMEGLSAPLPARSTTTRAKERAETEPQETDDESLSSDSYFSASEDEADRWGARRHRSKAALPSIVQEGWAACLAALSLERITVYNALLFAYDHAKHAEALVIALVDSLYKPSVLEASRDPSVPTCLRPAQELVARLYCVSDLLANASNNTPHAARFRSALQGVLPEVFEALGARVRSLAGARTTRGGLLGRAGAVLAAWERAGTFTPAFTQGLAAALHRPADVDAGRYPDLDALAGSSEGAGGGLELGGLVAQAKPLGVWTGSARLSAAPSALLLLKRITWAMEHGALQGGKGGGGGDSEAAVSASQPAASALDGVPLPAYYLDALDELVAAHHAQQLQAPSASAPSSTAVTTTNAWEEVA